jgi:hypothetical protein
VLQAFARACQNVSWIDDNRCQAECPICAVSHGGTDQDRNLIAKQAGDRLTLVCFGGHSDTEILDALHLTWDDLKKPDAPPRRAQESPPRRTARPQDDSLRRLPPQNLEAEQSVLGAVLIDNEALAVARRVITTGDFYREQHRTLFGAMCEIVDGGKPIDTVTLKTWLRAHDKVEQITPAYIAELVANVPSSTNIGSYAQLVQEAAVKRRIATDATALLDMTYNGVRVESLLGEWQRRVTVLDRSVTAPTEIPWEGLEDAAIVNEQYLQRRPVIDRLCYSSAVSMITGGKHAGKSTLARWMAICVCKGLPFLGREVIQGPVFYVASEDEEMVARAELIQLGWRGGDPLKFFGKSKIRSDEFNFLQHLTQAVRRYGVVLVVVDMLFDFVRVDDEMSYASTRRAVGEIQDVASSSEAHICVVHHAPKNANIGDATVAALGSQGLAARVSPIILVRRFGPGVHSVSSTGVRDPRGEAIPDSRLLRNSDGSVQVGGAFKNYMLGEVYAHRILDMLQAEEGSEITAPEVMEALDINYEIARASLSFLYKNNLVVRSGTGKKGHPFRYSILVTELSGTNQGSENQNTPLDRDKWGKQNSETFEQQGRFGYKEN